MKIYRLQPTVQPILDLPVHPVLVLGMFDGMHKGHIALFSAGKALAKEQHAPLCAWSFLDGAFKGETPLHTLAQRLTYMREAGADDALLTDFSAVRDLSPAAFIEQVLCGQLHCAGVVCGFHFHYGKDGAGDAAALQKTLAAEGIPVCVVEPVRTEAGELISTSAIRAALLAGDLPKAAEMAGRPYTICGAVLHGAAIGRTIGVPTVNQALPEGVVLPRFGVYASTVSIGENRYPAITNVGKKPTVANTPVPIAETHIIGLSADLYGTVLSVTLQRFLRPEQKFPSLEALRAQIARDIAESVAQGEG